jgi:hypothetical protein
MIHHYNGAFFSGVDIGAYNLGHLLIIGIAMPANDGDVGEIFYVTGISITGATILLSVQILSSQNKPCNKRQLPEPLLHGCKLQPAHLIAPLNWEMYLRKKETKNLIIET